VSKKTILQTYLDDKNNKHIGLFTTATTERLKHETKTATDKYEEYKTYAKSLDDKVLKNKVTANEADILKQSKFAEATKDLNQELLKGIKYNTDYAESESLLSKNAKSMSGAFSGIKSKLSSLGSSLKNIAAGIGNMLIIQGVMSVISWAFGELDNYTHRAENNLSDLEKITTEINDKKDAYTSHSTSVNKIKNEYYELADGVNSYGENISLTSTQYERYIELSNEIAQMYPNLVKGYSAQNDAILECKNNVEALNKAMADEKNAYYETIVSKEQDSFGKALENIWTNQGRWGADDETYITQIKALDQFVRNLNEKKDTQLTPALSKALKGAGVEDLVKTGGGTEYGMSYLYNEINEKDLSTIISAVKNQQSVLKRQINDLVNNSFKPVLDAYIHYTNEQFSTLDSKSQVLIEQYINSATWDNFYSKIIDPEASTADNLESVKQTVSGIVKAFNNPELTNTLDEVQTKIDDIRSGKIDVSDFKDLNNKVVNALSGIDGMNADTRELFVKVLFSDVEVADDVDINKAIANITKRVVGNSKGEFIPGTKVRRDTEEQIQSSKDVNEYLSTLDFSTIKQIYNSDVALNDLQDIQKLVEKIKAEASNEFSFKISTEDANKALESTFSAFNTVKSAISEYSENGTLSFSTLQSLLSLDSSYIDMLINEQGELDLTSNKFRELAKAQLEKLKVSYLQASLDEVNQLENETQVLEYLKKNQQGATESALNLADAKWQEAYATAAAKDVEQGTGNLYRQAVITAESAWRKKTALIDYYESSLSDLSTTTDKVTSATEKHKKALENEEKALEKTKEALENKKQALEDSKDGYEDALSAIEDLVDWTEKYIKQTKQNEIDALQERKDKIDELIEKKQELLDKEKEEADFNKQLKEKENAVASNALSAAITGLDDSSAGKKAHKENVDDLVESREDLYDYLSDYQYDTRKEALDKLKEETDKHYDDEIQTIQDFLNNEVSLHRAACNMIDNDNGTLYNNLLWYCQNYTTTTEAEFNHMWQSAQSALYEYGTAQLNVMDLMNTLQSRIYDVDSAIANVTGSIDNYTSRIDSLKQKIDELGNSAQTTKAKIDSVKIQPSSITGHGYKITYNGKVYKTNLTNKEDAETYFISRISNDWYGGRALPAGSLWSKMKAYASGTKSAKGGLSIVDEEGIGSELIPTSLGNGRYTILPQGNPVFSKAMTNELFEFASAPTDYFAQKFGSEITPNVVNNKSTVVSPAININVQGDATQATVNALHKESEKIMNNTIKKLMSYTVNNRHL
jgi:DNA repair exonuclease SbcCD ATPase subunit